MGVVDSSLARTTRRRIVMAAWTKQRFGLGSEVYVICCPLSRFFWKRQRRLTSFECLSRDKEFVVFIIFFPFEKKMRSSVRNAFAVPSTFLLKVCS